MTPCLAASKSQWRSYFREKVGLLTLAERAAASSQIRNRLEARSEWKDARVVLLFAPTPDEPDILPLARAALTAGKVVTFPRYRPENDSYEVARVSDVGRDLTPGRFRIPEPGAECARFALNELDFSLVPGIGFSLDGGRLGRGRGYFDRLLAAIAGFKCGVAFDCQVVTEMALEPHDICLDCILTPTRWHLTASRARS